MTSEISLSGLRWRTARLLLQNTRNVCVREHPLSIFDAVFKFAAGLGESPRTMEYFFHPLSRLEPVIRKNALYELELVFPLAQVEECRGFLNAVRLWLSDRSHNFALLETGEIRERSLKALEQPRSLLSGDELCLDFLTPLSILPATPRTLSAFDGPALFRLISNRLRRWYGEYADAVLSPFRSAFEEAVLLPWFWQYVEFHHRSKSHSGRQFVCGMQGPLYVRGNLARLLPPLLVMQELHLGPKRGAGQGAYRIRKDHPFMDRRLAETSWYASAFDQCSRESDMPFFHEDERDSRIAEACDACASGLWRSGCAEIFFPAGQDDLSPEAVLPPADLLVQRAVRNMLSPAVNNALPRGVISRRPERSRQAVQTLSAMDESEGRTWMLSASVEHLPESLSRQNILESIDAFLPRADTSMRALLREVVSAPARCGNKRISRNHGLLRGSPLSSLLTDLCLRAADCRMAAQGPYLRCNESVMLLAGSPEQAQNLLTQLEANLAPLGLALDEKHTVIRPLSVSDEDVVLSPGGRKPLHVLQPGSFVGMDGDSIFVRRNGELSGKAPLHATSGIFLYGAGGVSTRLVERCAKEGIALAFCSPSGMPCAALPPSSREWYAGIGAHAARHAALAAEERARAARTLVEAKLYGAKRWLLPRLKEKNILQNALKGAFDSLQRAETTREIMGVEGAFARSVFPLVNGLVLVDFFRSTRRIPREKRDPWNMLLDAAFSLLFARLHTRVLAAGLNPYLGFLHSSSDRYPSLVADLQEPFRHRVEQLALNLVNQNVIRPEHFRREGERLFMEREGYARLLRAFERLLATRFAGESLATGQGMTRLVRDVRRWAILGMPLRLSAHPCSDEENSPE